MADAPAFRETWLVSSCADCRHEWEAANYAARLEDFLAEMLANSRRCPKCMGANVYSKTPAKRLRDAAESAARLLEAEFADIGAAQPEGQCVIDLRLSLNREARLD